MLVRPKQAAVLRYGWALVASAGAFFISLAMFPLLELNPFLVFLAAVAVAAWYGGLVPGLLATLLCSLLINYFFIIPFYSLSVASLVAAVELVIFVAVAVLISSLNASLLEARQRAEAAKAEVEAALQQAEAAQERLATVALENERLFREASDAMHARDELISFVSHDLKNPLTSIRMLARGVGGRLAATGDPELERLVEPIATVESAATKMAHLIEELEDTVHVHGGEPLRLDRRPVDLVALARQLAAEHQLLTRRHRIRVESELPVLFGRWDAARLDRVLGNLLGNAIKYSPDGGDILVSVARAANGAGDQAILSVRDHGLGVPADDLAQVFDRFHRGANVVNWISGTGVGLVSVKRIVESHGGTVAVQSEEGAGSVFTVRLPLAEEDPRDLPQL
ncbi:MAG: DUF4118 domain-containing protein [Chloroflexi bacterium]|nr:DUF4118 domain-containing protein [Chloroflexota bacterium]